MKNLFLSALACIALVISSCNQNSPAPAPATPAPAPTPTSSMTATEALLVGDWIFDKNEQYVGGNLNATYTQSTIINSIGIVTTYTAYAGAHMVFKSSLLNNTVTTPVQPQYYDADYYGGNIGNTLSGSWQVRPSASGEKLFPAGTIPFIHSGNVTPYITTINPTTLIYQQWIPGQIPNGYKYYFHK